MDSAPRVNKKCNIQHKEKYNKTTSATLADFSDESSLNFRNISANTFLRRASQRRTHRKNKK